jgi:hypothetical protein
MGLSITEAHYPTGQANQNFFFLATAIVPSETYDQAGLIRLILWDSLYGYKEKDTFSLLGSH